MNRTNTYVSVGDSAALVGFPQDVAKHALSILCKTVVIRARSSAPHHSFSV